MTIEQKCDYMDVTNLLGSTVASIPTQSYTVTCSDVSTIDSAYDVLQKLTLSTSVRINPDGSISFESMNAEPKRPEKPENKEKEDMQRVTIPMPTKILRNGRATVVFFADNTKVIVKLPEGVEDSDYNAFCAAITKKMFGTNTRIKRKMEQITEIAPTDEEKKAAAEKARIDAVQKQQAEIERKVDRMARQIVLEKMAKTRAKEMMEGV